MMKNIESFLFASLPWVIVHFFFFLAPCATAVTVVNVKAQQRPKSNIVDVYYDLIAEDGGLFDISLTIEGGGDKPDIVTLEGDSGIDITPGRNKHIEWDAGADWPNHVQSNFVAMVTAMPSIGMVLIPGGTNSGADPSTGSYSLSTDSFYMDRTEVSYIRWKAVYDWAVKHGYSFDNAGKAKGLSHPVHTVNWYDCVKWCNARSEMARREPVYYAGGEVFRTGQSYSSANTLKDGYRLPTEEEWEYAARGGRSGLRFPWGNRIGHDYANYCNAGIDLGWYPSIEMSPTFSYHPHYNDGVYPYTAPVGSFAPNGYGLYDMAGNEGEWAGTGTGSTCAARGGGWGSIGNQCRMAYRETTSDRTRATRSIGFRTVRRP